MTTENDDEADGIVSLWVGSATSREAFDRALFVSFSPDGEFIGSEFSINFGIDYYDDVQREASYFPSPPRHVADLLSGSSYADIIIPRVLRLSASLAPGDNCVVLLYSFHYGGAAKSWS